MKTFSTIRARLGEVDLIRNGSVIPTLAGDNAPVGSTYFGPRGEPWRKTGVTQTSWIPQLMSAPALNVKTFGATGDGVTDDRPSIQAAFNAAIALGGARVYFPPGDYKCVLTGSGAGGIPTFLFTGAAQGNIAVIGAGRSSRVFMYSTTLGGDRRLFDIREGANNFVFKNIRFDAEITNLSEQQHLLHWQSLTTPFTGNALVEDVYLGFTRGDGMRFLGEGTNRVGNIIGSRICAQMVDPLARTFASYQRASDHILIDACYNQDVSAIDFEPTSNGDCLEHRITRNIFTGIITLTGADAAQRSRRSVFCDNIVHDGSVSGLNMDDWQISDNVCDFDTPDVTNFNVALIRTGSQVSVSDNLIIRGPNANGSAGFLSFEAGATGTIDSIVVSGNLGVQELSSVQSTCVLMRDLVRAQCTHNLFFPAISSVGSSNFIIAEAPNQIFEDAVISANLGLGLDQRMAGGIAGGGANMSCTDNFFRHVNNGILLAPVPSTAILLAARNMLITQSSSVSIVGLVAVGFPVDGIASLVGPTVFSCTNTPEANVPAAIGSIGLRVSGGGAGTTLYVKEADGGLSTGWAAK